MASGKLKKAFGVIFLFAVMTGISIPYIKGVLLKKELQRSVKQFNSSFSASDTQTNIEIDAYRVRYFKSEIQWSLRTPLLKPFTGSDRIVLLDRITHTFSNRVVSSTSLEQNPWYKKLLEQQPQGKDPVSITTEYYLSGDVGTTVDLSEFSFENNGGRLQVRSGQLILKYEDDAHKIVSVFEGLGFIWQGVFDVKPFRIDSEMKKQTDLIWAGKTKVTLDDLSFDFGDDSIRLTGFTGSCDLDHDRVKNRVSMDLTAWCQSYSSNLWDVSEPGGTIRIKNLDADAFKVLIRSSGKAANGLLANLSEGISNPDMLMQTFQQKYAETSFLSVDFYEKFLRKGVSVELNGFKAGMTQGEIKADVLVALKKNLTAAGLLIFLVQPSQVLEWISLDSDIRAPYTLIGYRPELMQPLFEGMQTGLFEVDDDYLVHQARIKDNQLFLNQKQVEFP